MAILRIILQSHEQISLHAIIEIHVLNIGIGVRKGEYSNLVSEVNIEIFSC